MIWLNGRHVFTNDAARPCSPDQDFVTLDLRQGANDLLLKVSNQGGDWAFYFNPTVSARLQAKLERLLDRDFPPTGEAAHYRIETIPLPDGHHSICRLSRRRVTIGYRYDHFAGSWRGVSA
jgi:hypothetical protein